MTSTEDLSQHIKEMAIQLGFDRAGICAARATPETRRLREWLERGYGGVMHYLERSLEKREDPSLLFEGAKSLVVVGLDYDTKGPRAPAHDRGSAGRVSRYTGGEDYHEVIGDRLRSLALAIEALIGAPLEIRCYVDTGPVVERAAAAHAGIGWIGKNCCLIDPEFGSYLFLGVLVTDLELGSDEKLSDQCGSCRACLDACPTGALEEPGLLNATRCIAYTTIEDPGPIPEALRIEHGDWVFGCDICQEVCPWNARSGRRRPLDALALRERLEARPVWRRPTLAWMLELDDAAWQQATRGSAMRRAKRRGLLRNALVAAGNSGDASLFPLLEKIAAQDDDLLAEHARWALRRLEEIRSAKRSACAPEDAR